MRQSRAVPVLAVLALLCWCACALLAQRVGTFAAGTSVRWAPEQGVSPVQLQTAERHAREDGGETLPDAVLWRETASQTLTRPDVPGGALAAVTQVYGSAELLYPLGFVSGWWPSRGDTAGCAVDETTAAALWGGTDAVGRTVEWNGSTYTVRGVFRGQTGRMVTQDNPESADLYSGLLLAFPGGGGREEAQSWLLRSQISGGVVLDTQLLTWCLAALAALPALLLGLGLIVRLLRRLLQLKTTPLLLLQFLPAVLVGGALVLWALDFPWALPGRLIPSRWSDFEFWGRLAGGFGETLRAMLALPFTQWDAALWGTVLGCLALVPVAAALVLLSAERTQIQTEKALAGWSLGALAALLLLVAAAVPLGGVAVTRGMWVTPLLWLAGDYLLRRHSAWLAPKEGGRDEDEKAIAGRNPQP